MVSSCFAVVFVLNVCIEWWWLWYCSVLKLPMHASFLSTCRDWHAYCLVTHGIHPTLHTFLPNRNPICIHTFPQGLGDRYIFKEKAMLAAWCVALHEPGNDDCKPACCRHAPARAMLLSLAIQGVALVVNACTHMSQNLHCSNVLLCFHFFHSLFSTFTLPFWTNFPEAMQSCVSFSGTSVEDQYMHIYYWLCR